MQIQISAIFVKKCENKYVEEKNIIKLEIIFITQANIEGQRMAYII